MSLNPEYNIKLISKFYILDSSEQVKQFQLPIDID